MNLKDYIRGQRRGKEANQLERKAMGDSFLQDAIDGYDSVEGNHISAIDDLEKRLSAPEKRFNKRIWIWAVAAAVVLLIGTPLLLNKPYMAEESTVVSDIIQTEEEIIPSLIQKDTILVADHHELNRNQDTASKVKETSSPSLPVEASSDNIQLIAENIAKDTEIANDIKNVPDKEIRSLTIQQIGKKTVMEERQKEISETLAGRVSGISTTITPADKLFVSGRIVDETGEPLVGVIIQLSDTHTGTISDTAGNFQLIVPNDKQERLIASYVGMTNVEIPLKENAGDIMMRADDMALNETVVIGYGVPKKRLFARSTSSVNEKETFGEKEFKDYFIENYDKGICEGQKLIITADFFIDPMGRPAHIDIKENSCPALESEIKRLLLGSPHWSSKNRKVTLRIELP